MIGKELKQQFAKTDEEQKEYIIAGKLGCSSVELIERVFKQNLLNELFNKTKKGEKEEIEQNEENKELKENMEINWIK